MVRIHVLIAHQFGVATLPLAHSVPEAIHALSTSSLRDCQWGGTYDRRFVAESNPSVINDALSGDVNGLRMLLSAASVPRAPRNQEILSSQHPACSREAA
jgi:hypothetical protein